jgi:hypothetical protein
VHTLVLWFGFLGAWLLFAGPVFQASVELRAEDEATDRMHRAVEGLEPPKQTSGWWWLVPPVHMILSARRSAEFRERVMSSFSAEDLQVIARYINIARGWMLVGLGAFLIALKETWELVEHEEWPTPVYWLLVLVMALLALAFTGISASRERELTGTPG